jgi:hypothetical protein
MKEIYSRRREELLESAQAQGITAAMLGTPMTFQELYQGRFIATDSTNGKSSSSSIDKKGTDLQANSNF